MSLTAQWFVPCCQRLIDPWHGPQGTLHSVLLWNAQHTVVCASRAVQLMTRSHLRVPAYAEILQYSSMFELLCVQSFAS